MMFIGLIPTRSESVCVQQMEVVRSCSSALRGPVLFLCLFFFPLWCIMKTREKAAVAIGILALLGIGYAVYFDHKRRNDPKFRRRLSKCAIF
jgi:hypothetical protein